jgi:hypothetical protein
MFISIAASGDLGSYSSPGTIWLTDFLEVLKALLSLAGAPSRSSNYLRGATDSLIETFKKVHNGAIEYIVRPRVRDPDAVLKLSNPTPFVHHPQFDAESIFWLLWFLLARANPTTGGEVPFSQSYYDGFCSTLFEHTVGESVDRRSGYLNRAGPLCAKTLHPSLSIPGLMLDHMRKCLAVSPVAWKKYDSGISEYHLHHIMKCLLLNEILKLVQTDGIPLVPETPRPVTAMPSNVWWSESSMDNRSLNGYSSPSDFPASAGPKLNLKRKVASGIEGSSKRRAGGDSSYTALLLDVEDDSAEVDKEPFREYAKKVKKPRQRFNCKRSIWRI